MRFNTTIRISVSCLFIFQMLLYMAIVIYAPALAFSQVSGLPVWVSIVSVGLVCTLYTSLGGLKAVLWTDVFLMIITYVGLIAVIILGIITIGGIDKVWSRAEDGGRVQFYDFDPNPTTRHTLFTLIIGGTFTTLTVYSGNQAMIQRYLCVKKLRDVQIAIYAAMFATLIFLALMMLVGTIMYAYYYDCDPIKSGKVLRGDQILPLFVLDVLNVPGIPGLFMACVFSAALSTVSSGLNSLSTVFLEDLIKPVYSKLKKVDFEDRVATKISKIVAVLLGLMTIALAFLCTVMPATLVQISLSLFGMAGGPILGAFSVGIFLPFMNSWGAGIGLLCSLISSFTLGIGATVASFPLPVLSTTTAGCELQNSTNASTVIPSTVTQIYSNLSSSTIISVPVVDNGFQFVDIFRLSYLYYSLVAIIVYIIIGSLVSLATGCNKVKPVDKKLLFPIAEKLCCCFSKSSCYNDESDGTPVLSRLNFTTFAEFHPNGNVRHDNNDSETRLFDNHDSETRLNGEREYIPVSGDV